MLASAARYYSPIWKWSRNLFFLPLFLFLSGQSRVLFSIQGSLSSVDTSLHARFLHNDPRSIIDSFRKIPDVLDSFEELLAFG